MSTVGHINHCVLLAALLVVSFAPSTSWSPEGGTARHQWRRATTTTSTTALMMARPLKPPPLSNAKTLAISWKEVAKRAAEGCTAAFKAGDVRRVCVDIPQISSVDRSTTARKFEDDNNFLLSVIESMGGSPEPVGKRIQIMEGGFEGGGDYLSDEGLYGYRFTAKGSGSVTAIGNAEIDSSALRDLPKLVDDGNRIILFNCNLDRLSFFDKIGMPSFENVETAYVLRRVGSGFLQRQYPQDFGVWRLEGSSGKPVLVDSQQLPYRAQQVEAVIRSG